MKLARTLQHPFVLVLQGFAAGALFLFSTNPFA